MRKVYVLVLLCLCGFVANAQLTADLCSGSTLNYTPTSGHTYTWLAPTGSGFINGTANVTPSTTINVAPTATTSSAVVVAYTVTDVTSTSTFTLLLTLNPRPDVNTISSQTVFNGTSTSAIAFAGSVAGTTFDWTNTNPGIGAIGPFGSGNIPSFLTNATTSTTDVVASFTVTPNTPAGCSGTPRNFTITAATTKIVICSNSVTPNLNFNNAAAFPAGTYTWSAPSVPGVTGTTSGNNSITVNQTLVNTTNAPLTVVYNLTEDASTLNFPLTVVVNPTPTVNSLAGQSQMLCAGTATAAVTFSSTLNVANTTFSWSSSPSTIGISTGTGNISPFVALNATAVPITATITVTPISNTCSGTAEVFTIVVNPTPTLSTSLAPFSPTGICNNTAFTYTAASATTGTSFAWTKGPVGGISSSLYGTSSSGNISSPSIGPETFANSTTSALSVAYVFTLTTPYGCSNSQSVTLLVNPTPGLSSTLTPLSICSSNTFNYAPTSATTPAVFTWSTPTITGITASGAMTGTGGVSQFLANATTAPITVSYYYRLSTNGCANNNVFTVTFDVNPTPSLAGTLTPASICSSNTFNYTALSTTNLTTTSYLWSRAPVTGIAGSSSGATAIISEPLVSTNTTSTSVAYNFTLTAYGCVNNQTVSVSVDPAPILGSTTTPTPICSGTVFSYTPTSIVTANYGWVRTTVTGISTAPGSGSNDPAEILTNTTAQPVDVPYLYTLTSPSGCGSTQTVTITVNPTPRLSSSVTPSAICTNATFSYTATSGTPGTVFSYFRPVSAVITNAPITVTGSGNISEALINPTINSAAAIYTFTLTANGCTNSQTITVNVNPTPILSPIVTSACSNASFSVTPNGVPAGTSYIWSTAAVTPPGAISAGNNAQSTPTTSVNGTLTNSTINTVAAVYTVTPSAAGCVGTVFTVTINLDPTPVIGAQSIAAICSGSTFSFAGAPASVPVSTTYTWGVSFSPTITGANTQSVGLTAVAGTLSSSASVSTNVLYTVVPAAGACTGTAFTLIVPVSPVPIISNQSGNVCSGGTFAFTPTSTISGTTYTWPVPTDFPSSSVTGYSAQAAPVTSMSQVLVNTTANAAQVVYNVVPSAGSCAGNPFTVVANVNRSIPSFGGQSATICNGTAFDVTPSSAPAGTTYTWATPTASPSGGVTGLTAVVSPVATVSQTLTNSLSATAVNIVSYTIVPIINSCNGPVFTATITVNPTPVLSSSLAPGAICNNTTFSYVPASATAPVNYNWSIAPTAGISIGGPLSGTGNVSQTLTNNTNAPISVSYFYTVATSGCANNNVFTVTFNVNPSSVLTNSTLTPTAICTSNVFTYTATASTILTSTNFTWTRPTVSGISSPGGSSGSGASISQQLINTNTTPTSVDYIYSLTAYGCTTPQTITVTVNPTPVLSSSTFPAPICTGTTFNYSPTNISPGTTFNWVRSTVAGITNGPGSGTGDPNEILNNPGAIPLVVTYTYTLITTSGCNNTQPLTLTVNPSPTLTSSLTPPGVCNGALFTYNATSATPGTIFNWSRAVVSPITNGAGIGVGNVSEVLVNPSITTGTAVYSYTLTANGCGNTQYVSVNVNPLPVVSPQATATCSNIAFSVAPAGQPTNILYTWAVPAISPAGSSIGGTAQAAGSSFIGQTLNNQTVAASTAVYTVTPNVGTCAGNTFTVTVTINPEPFVSTQVLPSVCSNTPFVFSATTVPTATTYTWGLPVISPTGTLTGAGAQPISQPSVSQTLISTNNIVDTAYYSVVPATAFCIGKAFSLTVTVKPLPVIADQRDTICSGAAFFITPSSGLNNTTFTWTAPVSSPTGSITGGSAQVLPVASISQVLNNVTTATAQTVYTITPNANNCAGPSFTLIETVARPVPAFGNIPVTICSGTPFDATPQAAPAGTVYTWGIPTTNPTGGVVGVSATSSRQTIVSQTLSNVLNVVDTVVYTVLPFLNNCQGPSFTATVRVQPITKAIISALTSVCQNPLPDTVTLKFTGTAPWNFTYSDGISTASKTGITTSPYTLTLPVYPKALTSRTISITNVKDFACLNATDTFAFTQKINPLPTGTIISLHGKYLCNGITDTLLVQSPDSVGYQWKLNNSFISGATTNAIATASAGTYNVVLTNKYNCTDTTATPYVLTFVQQPVLKFKVDTSCVNSFTHFVNLTDTSATGTIKWNWSFGNTKTDTAMTGSTTYLIGGKYHVQLKATQLFCTNYAPTTLDSTINIGTPIPGETLPSVSTYKRLLTPVIAREIPNYKYEWTPAKGIQNPDSASTNFQYDSSQLYIIKLISPLNCVTNDTMMVRVFDENTVEIFVPKSFTPNGDGVNDILYPYIAGIKTFHFFRVLNRYGKLLFETRDPDKGWNGMFNGGAQPMSVYFWVAEGTAADGSIVQKAGQVLLLR